MLASTWNSAPATWNGSASRTATCSAASRAAPTASASRSLSSSRNSSPPWRASSPSSPSMPRSRPAIRRSSRSPAPWPSESLTSLKLSRSMNSSATRLARRRARVTAARSRASNCARFGRPVSGSKNASRRTSSSARTRSVTSWPEESSAIVRPDSSCRTTFCQATRRRSPARETTSFSWWTNSSPSPAISASNAARVRARSSAGTTSSNQSAPSRAPESSPSTSRPWRLSIATVPSGLSSSRIAPATSR